MDFLQSVWGGIVALVKSSPIQVLTAIVASASFYRTFIQRPRLSLLPADTVHVRIPDQRERRFRSNVNTHSETS